MVHGAAGSGPGVFLTLHGWVNEDLWALFFLHRRHRGHRALLCASPYAMLQSGSMRPSRACVFALANAGIDTLRSNGARRRRIPSRRAWRDLAGCAWLGGIGLTLAAASGIAWILVARRAGAAR